MFVFMFLEFLKSNALFCHNRENEIKEKCGNATFCSNFDPAGLEGLSIIQIVLYVLYVILTYEILTCSIHLNIFEPFRTNCFSIWRTNCWWCPCWRTKIVRCLFDQTGIFSSILWRSIDSSGMDSDCCSLC